MSQGSNGNSIVSVVVPTLNEAANIESLLTGVFEATRDEQFAVEVIVVDDGSTDGTRERVKGWAGRGPVRLLERNRERGLAGAVLAAAACAQGDIVVVMDADLSHPPERIPDLVRPILAGGREMTIGSRYVSGGSTPGWPWRRRLMSRAASVLAWPLVDVRDPMSGFFAVRRERLLGAAPDAAGFKIGLEVLASADESFRVSEVPIAFTDRREGTSKLGAGQVFAYLSRLCALAGARMPRSCAMRWGLVGLIAMAIDLLGFRALFSLGADLSTSQVLSFVAASLYAWGLHDRWSFGAARGAGSDGPWSRFARFALVALLGMLLRAAVLGAFLKQGWAPGLAMLPAIAAGALVTCVGSAIFVFTPTSRRPSPAMRWRIGAVGIAGFLLLLRLFALGSPELLMEEAYYWNYAQHPALGYLDHPPMVSWLIVAGTRLLGDTEFGVRAGAFVCWCITAMFGYLTARDLFDKSTALRALLLVAALPFFFIFGFFMTPDAPLTASWAGAIFFLQRALLQERRAAWWGVGACIGLGMLSKYTIALLGPATLLFLLVDRRSRRWLTRPEPYVAALLAAAVFSPVIAWNAAHNWASFAFQSVRRLAQTPEFGLPLLIGSVLLLLTPLGAIGAFTALGARLGRAARGGGSAPAREFDPDTSRRKLFAVVFTLVPLGVFVAFSLRHDPKINWTGPVWLAVLPFLAWDMLPRADGAAAGIRAWGRRLWPATIAATALSYGVFLLYVTLGVPGVPYPRTFRMAGWAALGSAIETVEDDLERYTGVEPLVVGMDKYRIASELAFYRNRALVEKDDSAEREAILHTSSRHFFGESGLMYERWFPSPDQVGKTMILVDDEVKELLEADRVVQSFDHLSPTRVVDALTRLPARFYYRVGFGYRPPPESSGIRSDARHRISTN